MGIAQKPGLDITKEKFLQLFKAESSFPISMGFAGMGNMCFGFRPANENFFSSLDENDEID